MPTRKTAANNKKGTKDVEIYAMVGRKQLKRVVSLPKDLKTAVRIYGEPTVFDHFVRNFVIALQAQMRYDEKVTKKTVGSGSLADYLSGNEP